MRRTRSFGFTLTELMAVVVIIGVLGSVAMYSLSKTDTQPSVASLGRSVQLLLMRARLEALADHHQRRIGCQKNAAPVGSYSCNYFINTADRSQPVVWADAGEAINTGSGARAVIWNITNTVDYSVNNGGTTAFVGPAYIIFYPDGSSSGGTVYIADNLGKRAFYKVVVYPATSLARLITRW